MVIGCEVELIEASRLKVDVFGQSSGRIKVRASKNVLPFLVSQLSPSFLLNGYAMIAVNNE